MRMAAVFAWFVVAISGISNVALRAVAQESTSQKTASRESNVAYRLEFTFSELENTQRISSRTYSMVAAPGEANKLRIGAGVDARSACNPSNSNRG